MNDWVVCSDYGPDNMGERTEWKLHEDGHLVHYVPHIDCHHIEAEILCESYLKR
jgi:hypothetical protein